MLKSKITEAARIHIEIKSILESVLKVLLKDLEGLNPDDYRPYFVSESGLYILEGDILVLASIRDRDGSYGPGFTIPLDVVDSGDLSTWITEEKARRVRAQEEADKESAEREDKWRAGRKRIFGGGGS